MARKRDKRVVPRQAQRVVTRNASESTNEIGPDEDCDRNRIRDGNVVEIFSTIPTNTVMR